MAATNPGWAQTSAEPPDRPDPGQAPKAASPESPKPGPKAQDRIADLQARLGLSTEQTEKLRPIFQQEMEELRGVRQKFAADTSSAGRQAMRAEMKSVREKYDGQIAAILTPAQIAEWDKIKKERGDRLDQAQERLAELQGRLQLTPDQTESLRPILEQEIGEIRAVKAKYASDTSRQGKRRAVRAVRDIQDKYAPQIAAILNEEQMAEWEKYKEERKEELRGHRGK
jgi:hypothetical protein